MQTGLYVGLSSQIALERRLATIADNVANLSTVGFRATGIKFEDVVTGRGQNQIDFTSPGRYLSLRTRWRAATDRQHVRLRRAGRRVVFDPDPAGQVMTRDGRFTMLPTANRSRWRAIRSSTSAVAGIVLNPLAGAPQAAGDGHSTRTAAPAGALGLYTFDRAPTSRASAILAWCRAATRTDHRSQRRRRAAGLCREIELNPVMEMTRLISVQRAFDNITALIRDSEGSLGEAVRTLGSKT